MDCSQKTQQLLHTKSNLDQSGKAIDTIEEQLILELVSKLCKTLETEKIDYCHWKSNAALHLSASGKNDLDLLINRQDVQRFGEILYHLNFKRTIAPADKQMPGVVNYYGYDQQTGKLLHVHGHYQLVLGHDGTKNYRLPIEKAFLASATQTQLFKVPTPEWEFLVLVIRMVLKYSTWDVILTRQSCMPTGARSELEYLEPLINWSQLYGYLNQNLPYIDTELFNQCWQALQPDCSVWKRIRVGSQLQKALSSDARRPPMIDVSLKNWRRVVWGARRRLGWHQPKKRLASGGAMIALVGGDGAGKSTMVTELHTWLSQEFDTLPVHMGKPPWLWTSVVIRALLKGGRLLSTVVRGKAPPPVDINSPEFPGYHRLIQLICIARDRQQAYRKAQRFVNNGGIVICDRFALPGVMIMDGPQLAQWDEIRQNSWGKWLTQLEQNCYRGIAPPTLTVVLKLDPEIAVQRRQDENTISVRHRSTEVWQIDWEKTSAQVVDASLPPSQVLTQLKSLVWSAL